MNIDFKEKEYECMALIKSHPETFTYSVHNDYYYSKMFNVAIGNKRSLQKAIEQHCKSDEDKDMLGKLCNDYSADDMLAAEMKDTANGKRVLIRPLASFIEGREIEKQLQQMQQAKLNDKYVSGTVEAQYDNYLSVEEAADMHEVHISADLPIIDKEIEMGE